MQANLVVPIGCPSFHTGRKMRYCQSAVMSSAINRYQRREEEKKGWGNDRGKCGKELTGGLEAGRNWERRGE